MKFLAILTLSLFSFYSPDYTNSLIVEEGRKCYWIQVICPAGGTAEHCTTSGDGNKCTCGTVTRECGNDNNT